MIISIPIPPSANALFIALRNGSRVKSPVYQAWLKEVVPMMRRDPMPKPYAITIRANVNHRRDIDNLAKPILDALVKAGLMIGDQWVNEVHVYRDRTVHRCTVEILTKG
jgi:Holliday junction resolvase RusA-like endonuclease